MEQRGVELLKWRQWKQGLDKGGVGEEYENNRFLKIAI